jgi:type VI secretion system protein ImpE
MYRFHFLEICVVKAQELFEAGHLAAAIEQLNQDVRTHPTDARQRTFLFELLCFAGDYERAGRQLDILARQNAADVVGIQVYRNILMAEEARRRLFSHGEQPRFLFSPPPYTQWHLEALNSLRANQPAAALAVLEQSAQARPPIAGLCEGQPFRDFQDSDEFFGPFLEVIVADTYVWLPFTQIKHMTIARPERLRDLLWIQAHIEAHPGPVGEVFLPVLYPESSVHANDQVRLGRLTEWQDIGEGLARGVGQRMFLIDGEDNAMLEIRQLAFTQTHESATI